MLHISEVNLISVDKSEESWAIEGEVIFEDDLASGFEASYLAEEDEWEELSLELEIEEGFSMGMLKSMILSAIEEYEE
ncbi:hypothetical protein [Anaerotignum sp.]|nr:hypothetical protein [Anaerotignum sp.]MBQ7758926.1 hypothetical protein [Anaerotignum sp.]